MKNFLNTVHVALTPITPVHIGCNEDYEPTNYVIRQGWLYSFDPAEINLNRQDRSRLIELGEKGDFLSIQRFFRDNPNIFLPATKKFLSVTNEINHLYTNSLGTPKGGNKKNIVLNRLGINRTTYHPYTNMAYLPGSSIKGAIRTAILDRLNTPPIFEKERALENTLLGVTGRDFSQSPFRKLKVSDFCPTTFSLTQVLVAKQFKKKKVINQKTGEVIESGRIPTNKEVIFPAQYRCYHGDIQVDVESQKLYKPNVISSTENIAKDCNRYYMPQFLQELKLLEERGLVSSVWLSNMKTLFSPSGNIYKLLESNKAFLLRLGMYGGAESKTYRSPNVAQIQIMQGKGKPAIIQDKTTTLWLASINDKLLNRQPFGWCLLETNPDEELLSLKQWSEQQIRSFPDEKEISQSVEEKRRKLLIEKQRKQEEKAALEKRRQEEEEERSTNEMRLAAMSEIEREIENMKILLGNVKKGAVGSQEFALCRERLEHISSTWTNVFERNQLREVIVPILKQKDLIGNKRIKVLIQELKNPL